jgi:hypothetical protein
MSLILLGFRLEDSPSAHDLPRRRNPWRILRWRRRRQRRSRKPPADGNRYTRAARVLAKDDTIDVKTLADRAYMSETTAARCLEAWQACVGALREVGKLPDPAKKKAPAPEEGAQGRGRDRAAGRERRRPNLIARVDDVTKAPERSGAFSWASGAIGARSRRDTRRDRGPRAVAGGSGSTRWGWGRRSPWGAGDDRTDLGLPMFRKAL